MSDSPNYAASLASMTWARRVDAPAPSGQGMVDHSDLVPILDDLRSGGIARLPANVPHLDAYRSRIARTDPDTLGPAEALAFWVNLYNAGALLASARAYEGGATSILRVPGVFRTRDIVVAGEPLSLDDIEHGKVRRFGDPRIHAALVCGSVSCPTLRFEPFVGTSLDRQLDEQMRTFLASGGMQFDERAGTASMNSIFLWYGTDFVRPDRMPSLMPVAPGRIRDTVAWWLPADERSAIWSGRPRVEFQSYDWGLACSVA